MQLIMRRLHPRGAANRGICVDAEGAMLGPDCILVRRSPHGFRGIEREHAQALQKCALMEGRDRDLLFRQSQRIAEALDKGEIALAQIYGLHIPVVDLDDRRLARISKIDFARGYNPDEPRIPKGNPHGGEWTTGETPESTIDGTTNGGADDDEGGGDSGDGAGDSGNGGGPPATGQFPSGSLEAMAATRDQGDRGDTAPVDQPAIEFKWPDASPPSSAPPAQPPSASSGSGTLGSPDLGDGTPNAAQPSNSQPPPPDSGARPSGPDRGDAPPPNIPTAQPSTTKEINAVLRSLATWLGRALAVLDALYEFDPEVVAMLAAIEAADWLADYLPKIFSYLDAPKTLSELQNAATRPAPAGYEIHHIVEAQRRSKNEQSNAKRFPDQIDSRENLVD